MPSVRERTTVEAPMEHQSTCAIVDDHEVVRTGTVARLASVDWITTQGEAGTAAEGLELIRRTRPDLALVDVRLPDGSGLDVAVQLAAEGIATKVVLYSGAATTTQAEQALESGVSGFVLKDSPLSTVLDALHAARDGRRYLDPTIAAELMMPRTKARLSPREVEILRRIADGGQNATIAFELGISVETVKAHVSNILSKFDAESRTHAVAMALREGIID